MTHKVYICSPYKGDVGKNTLTALRLCELATDQGLNPICPHVYYTQWLRDDNERERLLGLNLGMELLADCQSVWCWMADGISVGMQGEIYRAESLGLPVLYITDMAKLAKGGGEL